MQRPTHIALYQPDDGRPAHENGTAFCQVLRSMSARILLNNPNKKINERERERESASNDKQDTTIIILLGENFLFVNKNDLCARNSKSVHLFSSVVCVCEYDRRRWHKKKIEKKNNRRQNKNTSQQKSGNEILLFHLVWAHFPLEKEEEINEMWKKGKKLSSCEIDYVIANCSMFSCGNNELNKLWDYNYFYRFDGP